MEIGIPKERKLKEYRVGLIPESVSEIIKSDHTVYIESNAGFGIGVSDNDYKMVGAKIVPDAEALYDKASLIVKVKEPTEKEWSLLTEKHILFCFLHLASSTALTDALLKSKCSAIAYETVTDDEGRLPLLTPMSEIAGCLSVQMGIRCLEKTHGGMGRLIGRVAGVEPSHVVILGGGVVGTHAARIAIGLNAKVTVIDKSLERLKELQTMFDGRISTLYSTKAEIEKQIKSACLVIGSVLIPGAKSPKLITKKMLGSMMKGSVLVDVSIDQGGCFETSSETFHDNPTFIVDDVVHYCVSNLPGCVPQTSIKALNNATLPYVLKLANEGLDVLKEDSNFLNGLNVHKGYVTHKIISQEMERPYMEALNAITTLKGN